MGLEISLSLALWLMEDVKKLASAHGVLTLEKRLLYVEQLDVKSAARALKKDLYGPRYSGREAYLLGLYFRRNRVALLECSIPYLGVRAHIWRLEIMITRAQDAVFTWMIVGKRIGISSDVRQLIAKIVWAGRANDYDQRYLKRQRKKYKYL